MAAYEALSSKHAVLSPGVADTVTLTVDWPQVEVLNRNGAAEIYFTVDGAVPTVGGDNTYVVPSAVASQVVGSPASGRTVVRLISSGAASYTVSGVER